MICYKCPNCGRMYRYEEEGYYQCLNCRYPLKKEENVKTIRHPELNPMLSDNHVIGYVSNQKDNVPKCPTCSSTNIKKVSGTSKVISVAVFGFLSQKVKKTFHCNSCGYEW